MNKDRLKRIIKRNPFGAWLVKEKDKLFDCLSYQKRKPYIPAIKSLILGGNYSIITTNCFAGRIMQDIGMEYNTPTLGLYFMYPDYIEFLRNIEYYLKEAKIEFQESSKYPLGNERRAARIVSHHWYPIGLLGGKVEIHFLHYHTEEEAAQKWYRRASRVNFDKLFVIGMEQNLCTENDIREFEKLPFENKFIFTTHDFPELKSNIFLPEFVGKGEVGDAYKSADIYYRRLLEQFQ